MTRKCTQYDRMEVTINKFQEGAMKHKRTNAQPVDDPRRKEEEILARLREIDRILDRTDPRENPIYRNERRRLNRERTRLFTELRCLRLTCDPDPLLRGTKSALEFILNELED